MGYPTDLNDLADRAYKSARDHGFWDDPVSGDNVPTKLMLIVTEAAEAMEIYRKDGNIHAITNPATGAKPEGFVYELADIIIRVLDISGRYDLNIQQAVWNKMAYNNDRPFRHGKIV